MKKISLLMIGAGMMAFVACGPSAEEKAAKEKQSNDSIAAVASTRVQDSMMQVQKMQADSMASAAKMAADSVAAKMSADSIAGLKNKVKKPTIKPVKPTIKPKDVKAGQGKG